MCIPWAVLVPACVSLCLLGCASSPTSEYAEETEPSGAGAGGSQQVVPSTGGSGGGGAGATGGTASGGTASAGAGGADTAVDGVFVAALYNWNDVSASDAFGAFSDEFGREPACVVVYGSYGDYENPSPQTSVDAWYRQTFGTIHAQGAVVHHAVNPWEVGAGVLDRIASGELDAYVRRQARAVAKLDFTIQFRFMYEFNGDWDPHGIANNGQDPTKYVKAWRHVHGIYADEGASNVEWVWEYNRVSVPNEPWNDPALAYPGDDYVDWIGISAYNFGAKAGCDWCVWETFEYGLRDAYAKAREIAPGKPVQLSEHGSTAWGGDRAEWIRKMFLDLPQAFPEVRLMAWYNVDEFAITHDSSAREAYAAGLANDWVRDSGKALAELVARYAPVE
jgi:hypothetical protein